MKVFYVIKTDLPYLQTSKSKGKDKGKLKDGLRFHNSAANLLSCLTSLFTHQGMSLVFLSNVLHCCNTYSFFALSCAFVRSVCTNTVTSVQPLK